MFLAANAPRTCSVREIADHYGISRNHLVKVAHRLAQLGHVESTKGKGGGLKLAHDPTKLRLGDLVRQLEPNMTIVECFDRDTNTCRVVSSCQMKHYMAEASSAFLEALNKHTLADAVINKRLFLWQAEAGTTIRSSP